MVFDPITLRFNFDAVAKLILDLKIIRDKTTTKILIFFVMPIISYAVLKKNQTKLIKAK